jgi:hypothetical protein
VCALFYSAVRSKTTGHPTVGRMMKWRGFGRKWPLPYQAFPGEGGGDSVGIATVPNKDKPRTSTTQIRALLQ